jgi:hypothetical protein
MPDPLLVTIISLKLFRYILFPGQKVLRQISENVQDRYLLTQYLAQWGMEKRSPFCDEKKGIYIANGWHKWIPRPNLNKAN